MADTTFSPNWASCPGQTIVRISRSKKLSPERLAESMGCRVDEVQKLMDGSSAVTEALAESLARVLGASRSFWLSREHIYRERLHKLAQAAQGEKFDELVNDLPIKEMVKFGWIHPGNDKLSLVSAVLKYFGVSSYTDWQECYSELLNRTAFRMSQTFNSDRASVATWLRCGELEASKIDCAEWNKKRFAAAMPDIRDLTRVADPQKFIPALQNISAACGVAVVVAPAPAGCRASGAAYFPSQNRPVLLLSMRHLTDDHFWFSFFHEAGHLILHDPSTVFLDSGKPDNDVIEEEANQFATNTLIPPSEQPSLRQMSPTYKSVIGFARAIGVSPGIVVGQLQHLRIVPYGHLNRAKRRYEW